MNGLDRVPLLPFVILPNVQQHCLRIIGKSLPRFVNADFLDVRPRFVDKFEKSR